MSARAPIRFSALATACSTSSPVKISGAMPHQAPHDGMSRPVTVQACAAPTSGVWAVGVGSGAVTAIRDPAAEQAESATASANPEKAALYGITRRANVDPLVFQNPRHIKPEPCHAVPGTSARAALLAAQAIRRPPRQTALNRHLYVRFLARTTENLEDPC